MAAPKLKTEIFGVDDLKRCYMPFLKRKGLFVPTAEVIPYGEHLKVDLDLGLGERHEQVQLAGRVVWVTPESSYQHPMPGVGIEFSEESAAIMQEKLAPYLPLIEESTVASATL